MRHQAPCGHLPKASSEWATAIRLVLLVTLLAIPGWFPTLAQGEGEATDLDDAADETPRASLDDVEAWLGTYELAGEAVTLRWKDGLIVDLGPFTIPADGLWHESTEPFAVVHRVTWNPERRSLKLDELFNNNEIRWHYELRAVPEKARLERFRVPESGDPMLVRVYPRTDPPASEDGGESAG